VRWQQVTARRNALMSPRDRPRRAPVSSGYAKTAGAAFLWEGTYLGGTRAIQLLRFVILARLLAPHDFGLLAVAWSVVEVGQGLSDWGLDKAVVQRSDVSDREYNAAWTLDLLRCLALAIVIGLAAPGIAAAFGEARATNLIRVLGLTPVFYATGSIKRLELQRRLDFRSLTFIRLPEVLVEAVVAITLVPWIGVWALAVAALVSISCTVALSYVLAPHRPRLVPDWSLTVRLLRFGRWLFVTGVAVMVGEALLRAVVSRQLGTEQLGLFYLATRLASLPLSTVSQVVWTVGISLHARLQADVQRGAAALQQVLITMSALLLPAYALLFVLADSMTVHVLGPKWSGAAPLIKILALGNMAAIGAGAIRPMLDGRGYPQYSSALIGATQTMVISLAAWVGGPSAGIVGVAWGRALVDFALLPAWVWAARRLLPDAFRGIGKIIVALVFSAAVAALAALGLVNTIASAWGTLIAAVIGAAVTLMAVLTLDQSLKLGFVASIKNVLPQTLFASSS
jgi:O-antigen/teichoic acid export membrane protein